MSCTWSSCRRSQNSKPSSQPSTACYAACSSRSKLPAFFERAHLHVRRSSPLFVPFLGDFSLRGIRSWQQSRPQASDTLLTALSQSDRFLSESPTYLTTELAARAIVRSADPKLQMHP